MDAKSGREEQLGSRSDAPASGTVAPPCEETEYFQSELSQRPEDGQYPEDETDLQIRLFFAWIKSRDAKLTDWILAFTSVALTIVGLSQLAIAWQSYHDTSPLAGYASESSAAAQDNADAAQQFADSTEEINSRIADAVDRLNTKAANTQKLAQEAASQTEIAKQSLHIANAPFLIVPYATIETLRESSTRENRDKFESTLYYKNIGKTPALSVIVTARIETGHEGALFQIPAYDGLSGETIAVDGSGSFTASGPTRGRSLFQVYGTSDGFSVFGYVQYKDIFQENHLTAFCNYYPHRPEIENSSRPCNGNWFEHPPKKR